MTDAMQGGPDPKDCTEGCDCPDGSHKWETAMNKCPNIGTRVKTKPTYRYGELTGTVMAIYPTHDDEWDESTHEVIPGPLRAEREWRVGVRVDVLPPHWSYVRTDRFFPEVKELVRL